MTHRKQQTYRTQ